MQIQYFDHLRNSEYVDDLSSVVHRGIRDGFQDETEQLSNLETMLSTMLEILATKDIISTRDLGEIIRSVSRRGFDMEIIKISK